MEISIISLTLNLYVATLEAMIQQQLSTEQQRLLLSTDGKQFLNTFGMHKKNGRTVISGVSATLKGNVANIAVICKVINFTSSKVDKVWYTEEISTFQKIQMKYLKNYFFFSSIFFHKDSNLSHLMFLFLLTHWLPLGGGFTPWKQGNEVAP